MKNTKIFNYIKAQTFLKFPFFFYKTGAGVFIKNNRRAIPVVIIDLISYKSSKFKSINQAAIYLKTDMKPI